VFGLAAELFKVKRVNRTIGIGGMLAGLMFVYAMKPGLFGAPLAALWNQPVRFSGLAFLCVGTAVVAVSLQEGGPNRVEAGLLAVCGGLFLLTAAWPFLVVLAACAAAMARGRRAA